MSIEAEKLDRCHHDIYSGSYHCTQLQFWSRQRQQHRRIHYRDHARLAYLPFFFLSLSHFRPFDRPTDRPLDSTRCRAPGRCQPKAVIWSYLKSALFDRGVELSRTTSIFVQQATTAKRGAPNAWLAFLFTSWDVYGCVHVCRSALCCRQQELEQRIWPAESSAEAAPVTQSINFNEF